jgi:hypothetical protein
MAEQETTLLDDIARQGESAQKLAISMCHFADTGGLIKAISATVGLEEDQLNKAIDALISLGLLERGSLVETGKYTAEDFRKEHPTWKVPSKLMKESRDILEFQVDETGDRYRLQPNIKKAILKEMDIDEETL